MKKNLLFSIICIIVLLATSCTSRKKLIYMNDHPKGDTVMAFNRNDLSVILQPGDVVYIKVLSLDKETSALFNLDDRGGSSVNNLKNSKMRMKRIAMRKKYHSVNF